MKPLPHHGYGTEDARSPGPLPLATPDTRHRPRRWVALLLSLVTAGLGHVYVGAWKRGAKLMAVLAALGVIGAALAPHAPWWLALLLFLPMAGARLVTALDVLRVPDLDLEPRTAGRIALEVGVGWLAFTGLAILIALPIRLFLLEAFKIPAGSMRPTVEVGDHLFVDKKNRTAQRGQLMVFEFPENREQDFIMRIVALAGDVVEIDDQGWLSVNGQKAPTCSVGEIPATTGEDGQKQPAQTLLVEFLDRRPHLILRDPSSLRVGSRFGPFTVPAGQVFVLGDNRDNSHDSRGWDSGRGRGVPVDHFKGVPFVVWLSFGPQGLVVWDRIGLINPPHLSPSSALAPALARCLASVPPSAVPAPSR